MKQIEGLRWAPRWVSHLGCIKGGLASMDLSITDGWLYGGTSHAFVINIHDEVCPSGPTAWRSGALYRLGRNLGYQIEGVHGPSEGHSLDETQKRAWDLVRRAIDEGRPCYGWELAIPEYYVIYGYDDDGYYYSGPGSDEGAGPADWRNLGRTGIGIVEVCSLRRGEPSSVRQTVRQAVEAAVDHADNPDGWRFPRYTAGPGAYDVWIRSVRETRASRLGMSYNSAVWAECRRFAAAFLHEAAERLRDDPAQVLEKAARHYETVASHLGRLVELYPFSPGLGGAPIDRDDRIAGAAEALEGAKAAETAGLELLRQANARMADKA